MAEADTDMPSLARSGIRHSKAMDGDRCRDKIGLFDSARCKIKASRFTDPTRLEIPTQSPIISSGLPRSAQVGRSSSLDVKGSSNTFSLVLELGHLPSSAPHLVSLLVEFSKNDEERRGSGVRVDEALQAFFDRIAMPSLQKFILRQGHGEMKWSKVIFPHSLSELTIAGGEPGVTDVLRLLHGLPLLERLSLSAATSTSPHYMASHSPATAPVTLSRLKKMSVGSPMLQLLKDIIHPTTTSFIIYYHSPHPPLPLLLATLHPKISQRVIDAVTLKDYSLSFHGGDRHRESCITCYISYLGLSSGILGEFCAQLPLQQVTKLNITGYVSEYPHGEAWIKLLQTLVGVTDLNIQNYGCSHKPVRAGMLTFLRPLRGRQPSGSPNHVQHLLPNLKRISLTGVSLGFRKEGGSTRTLVVKRLSATLKSREEAGCRVEEVQIKDCRRMDKRDVSFLRECVQVEWDGKGTRGGSLPTKPEGRRARGVREG